jgi:hypothetical protein
MRLRLPSLFLLRRLSRDLAGIRDQLARQTDLLQRLADHFAPADPVTDRATVSAETGVDYVDATDQLLIQQYIARTQADTGHTPTDDEILSYLADEKTHDLHTRLIERDREIERIAAERRW